MKIKQFFTRAKLLILGGIIAVVIPVALIAQNIYSTTPVFVSDANYSLTGNSSQFAIGVIDAKIRGNGLLVSPSRGYVKAGLAGASRVDMNGIGGTAVGVYGIAEGVGRAGGVQDEIVGIYGRADKNGLFWATALHGECTIPTNRDPNAVDVGGLCIGLNLELQGRNTNTNYLGINIQPGTTTSGVVGLQFQNAHTYKYSIDAQNTFIKVGQVNDVPFCIKFNPVNQYLEFWRKCNEPGATRTGFINMNYNTPNGQLN